MRPRLTSLRPGFNSKLHVCFADITKHTSPDCSVLRTPAIFTVLAIRPIRLLARTDERL